MDRTACVDVPALPLQLLLRRHPDWTAVPVAVVAEDRPQGVVLWINEAARRGGVRTGMRYSAALSLARGLRAGEVPGEDIAAGIDAVVARLYRFTPGVEASRDEPGVFHLDASGLLSLHGSLDAWAAEVRRDLADAGFRSRMAVGFTRFGVYAATRAARGVVVFATPEDETSAARCVPLDRLIVEPVLRDALAKLGVRTVEDLLHLPEEGLLRRFGGEAQRLRRFAEGGLGTPLARTIPPEPLEERVAIEHPETDATRLVFLAKRLVDGLLAKAVTRGDAVTGIELRLELDRGPPCHESLRLAAPTLDAAQILDLVHLRLGALRLTSGVTSITLAATSIRATEAQRQLFAERPRRDLAAADRAFARLAAEFGEGAVVVARLADSHLPEAQFVWDVLVHAERPRPRILPEPPLVRRIFETPRPLPHRDRHEPDGWLIFGLDPRGRVVGLSGQWTLSTRWWRKTPVEREYCFAETPPVRLSWVFHDAASGTWFSHGEAQ